MINTGFITYKENYLLYYQVFGEGDHDIICFHGFGQEASIFSTITQKHPNARVISIDLPFHGQSQFPNKKVSKVIWKEVSFLLFQHFKIEKATIIAYSLGGRFAIRMAVDHASKINQLIFIAADGFYLPKTYRLATSWLGKHLFHLVVTKPSLFFSTVDQLTKLGITNPSMAKFAKNNLASNEQREKVYLSWNYLKPLGTSSLEFALKVKSENIPVDVYVGKKDYVIKEHYFDRFLNIYPAARKIIFNKRHHEMIDTYVHAK